MQLHAVALKAGRCYTRGVNRFAPTALMLGNVVTGCSVLAPAGMLGELVLRS